MTAASKRLAQMAAAVLLSIATPVLAGPADDAFRKGRELFKAGQYPEACAEFEESQKLDPQLGTLFNLAQCHEKIGKLASAHAAYREVMTKDVKADRRTFAADLAKKIAPRVPKLIVEVEGQPVGLVVRIGERRITANRPVEVDNGSYKLRVQAFGMQEVLSDVSITASDEGRTLTVVVPMTASGAGQAAMPTQRSSPTEEERPRSTRKVIGIASLGVGVATLAVGGVFGWHAMSSWSDAEAMCMGTECPTETEAERANELRDTALRSATVSNVLFVAGGVLVLTGVVLWATAPSGEQNVAVSALPTFDGATVTLAGRF